MPIYRYSAAGIARLERQARNKAFGLWAVGLLAGFAISTVAQDARPVLAILPGFAICAGILFWAQRRGAGRVREMLRSTEFEIDEHQLIGRTPLLTVTLQRDDVVELRYMADGILVRTRNLRNAIQLKPELEGYEDLAGRLEKWVPPGTPRVRASSSLNWWTTVLPLASLALMTAAFTITDPLAGIILCLASATVLIFFAVWAWRSQLPARTKRLILIGVLPIASLLGRAYLLSGQL